MHNASRPGVAMLAFEGRSPPEYFCPPYCCMFQGESARVYLFGIFNVLFVL